MNDYYPFIDNPKKKEWEPEPLYVEIESPLLEKEKVKEPESPGVIVIELF